MTGPHLFFDYPIEGSKSKVISASQCSSRACQLVTGGLPENAHSNWIYLPTSVAYFPRFQNLPVSTMTHVYCWAMQTLHHVLKNLIDFLVTWDFHLIWSYLLLVPWFLDTHIGFLSHLHIKTHPKMKHSFYYLASQCCLQNSEFPLNLLESCHHQFCFHINFLQWNFARVGFDPAIMN